MWYKSCWPALVALFLCLGQSWAFELVHLTSLYDSTGSCSHQSSLEYGFTVSWDPDNNFHQLQYAFRPGWIFDCVITFIGRTDLDGMPTRTSLAFREDFLFADVGLTTTGTTIADCGKAFIRLWRATQYPHGAPIWTHCSIGDLPGIFNGATGQTEYVYEAPIGEHDLVLQFYVDFNIQVINNATMNPNFTTTTVITTPNPLDYPRIHFHADFTSYVHNDSCINPENEVYLRCNDSQRCLERTDVCDVGFAWNCRDNDFFRDGSDRSSGYPAYCGRQSLPEIIIDLTPLWVLLGLLAAAMVMYWCCWKPGYIPWRCGRLRNVKGGCCGSADGKGCCAAGGLCGPGGFCGPATPEGKAGACSCCSKCFSCCQGGSKGGRYGGGGGGHGYRPMGANFGGGRGAGPRGGGPRAPHTGGRGDRANAGKQGLAAGDWFDYCAGDGFHLVECR